jgi:hypothetical protein
VVAFSEQQMSTDGGALLLREVDRRIQLLGCLTDCFQDGVRIPVMWALIPVMWAGVGAKRRWLFSYSSQAAHMSQEKSR